MRKTALLLCLITLLFGAPMSSAHTSVSAFCDVAKRLAQHPKAAELRSHALFKEASDLCNFTYDIPRVPDDWEPWYELKRYPVPYDTSFPHARPAYSAPNSVPYCGDGSAPFNIVCGNAVPVSCIWQC